MAKWICNVVLENKMSAEELTWLDRKWVQLKLAHACRHCIKNTHVVAFCMPITFGVFFFSAFRNLVQYYFN